MEKIIRIVSAAVNPCELLPDGIAVHDARSCQYPGRAGFRIDDHAGGRTVMMIVMGVLLVLLALAGVPPFSIIAAIGLPALYAADIDPAVSAPPEHEDSVCSALHSMSTHATSSPFCSYPECHSPYSTLYNARP